MFKMPIEPIYLLLLLYTFFSYMILHFRNAWNITSNDSLKIISADLQSVYVYACVFMCMCV